jgi:hypothetical protein
LAIALKAAISATLFGCCALAQTLSNRVSPLMVTLVIAQHHAVNVWTVYILHKKPGNQFQHFAVQAAIPFKKHLPGPEICRDNI